MTQPLAPGPDWSDPSTRARTVPDDTPERADIHFVIRQVPTSEFCEVREGRPGVVYLREEVSSIVMASIENAIGIGYEFVIEVQFPTSDSVPAPPDVPEERDVTVPDSPGSTA
jgi:hypothetical protein